MKCILNVGPAQLEMGMQLNTKFEKGVGNVIEYLSVHFKVSNDAFFRSRISS